MNCFVMEFLFSKMEAYQLKLSASRVIEIPEILEITSTLEFLFTEVGANRLFTE